MMRRGCCRSLLIAGILALLCSHAYAQAIGSIFGKVTDGSGAVLPGVTVTVTGPSLQQPLVAVTTATGAYPAWVVNHAYKVGDRVSYAGHNYQCLQAHTSQADWTPSAAPSLWQFLS